MQALQWFYERIVLFSLAIKAKIDMPKERAMSSNSFGVYPDRGGSPPSPVCCFRVMHIRTGTIWIAYLEMMWITTQLSFLTAQAVTSTISPVIIFLGFVFTAVQIGLVLSLIKGVRQFLTQYIWFYMVGLVMRIILFICVLFLCSLFGLLSLSEDLVSPYKYFRSHAVLKIVFCTIYIFLKLFALITTYRCYKYINITRASFRFSPTLLPEILRHSDTMESTATFRTVQNNQCPLWMPMETETRLIKA